MSVLIWHVRGVGIILQTTVSNNSYRNTLCDRKTILNKNKIKLTISYEQALGDGGKKELPFKRKRTPEDCIE